MPTENVVSLYGACFTKPLSVASIAVVALWNFGSEASDVGGYSFPSNGQASRRLRLELRAAYEPDSASKNAIRRRIITRVKLGVINVDSCRCLHLKCLRTPTFYMHCSINVAADYAVTILRPILRKCMGWLNSRQHDIMICDCCRG
jgi:hypothetical protein